MGVSGEGRVPSCNVVDENTVQCCHPDCQTLLSTLDSDVMVAHYQEHLRNHHESSCPKCYQRFDTKKHIEDHFLTLHARLDKNDCPFCPRKLWLKRQLNSHINSVHSHM